MRRANHGRGNPARSGFTLLEVMVALAVAAIGLAAISKSLSTTVEVADRLSQRTLATWVASNRMAELRMTRQFVSNGSQSSEARLGEREWRTEERYSATPDPDISRVVVNVFEGNEKRVAASLSSYLARYRPADPGS